MEHHHKTDRVERWLDLPVPAAEVWALIGDFFRLDLWHPGVESSEKVELEGELYRHVRAKGGATFLEKLEAQDDRMQRYSIAESGLPVENYLATLTCFDREEPGAEGCRVYWSASFDSDHPEADEIIAGIFESGLRGLRDRFGG